MLNGLREELQGGLDLLFPPACPLCCKTLPRQDDSPFCQSCSSEILPLPAGRCSRCALPFPAADGSAHLCESCSRDLPPFLSVFSAGLYDAGLRKAIHRFKYENGHYLDRPLTSLLYTALEQVPDCDLLVPVPLHRRRLRKRTYNQSLLLARELGRLLLRPVAASLLTRVRDTPQQQGLRAGERARNLRGAFVCRQPVAGKRILLVDDVMTTGATAAVCSQTLLVGGADEVRVAVVGRAGRA